MSVLNTGYGVIADGNIKSRLRMSKTAIVILNWNGSHLLKRFLPSVVKYSNYNWAEIVVADNKSGDDSREVVEQVFPGVKFLSLDSNFGFAEGYNRALAQVEAEYFVLLNSDVEITAGWLIPMIEILDKNSRIAACMPKILSVEQRDLFEHAGAAGGFIDRYGYPFCQGRIFNSIEADQGQYNQSREIGGPTQPVHHPDVGSVDSGHHQHGEHPLPEGQAEPTRHAVHGRPP